MRKIRHFLRREHRFDIFNLKCLFLTLENRLKSPQGFSTKKKGRQKTYLTNTIFGTPFPQRSPENFSADDEIKGDGLGEGEGLVDELGEVVPFPCGWDQVFFGWGGGRWFGW